MDSKDGKRRKDKYNDNDDSEEYSKDSRSKRRRSRSRTPKENRNENSRYKRKHSKSPTPRDSKQEKRSSEQPKEAETKRDAPVRKAKETDMLNTRTGGAYIPPARLRMMQAQITDKSSVAYQRLAWEALKKSIHGHINKINVGNIGIIIKELLKENIVRGRGLICRSVIQAQAASPTFTNVYAALVSAVNSRFPNIGELLLKRLVIQFKRGFKRNDKPICISSASFIAHLVNQKVAHEILALELLTLLVETPTDDSVEVSIAFLKECGQKLTEVSSKGVNAIFEMLRNILHEGQLDKRVQYMIEVMFQVWKDGFKDHPAVIEELELVPEEEQFTHLLMLDDATDSQDILNVFKFDDKYEENEQKYKTLSKEILGSEAESGEDDGSEGSGSEESDEEEEDSEKKEMTIIDKTETNLVALRRTIYLTINSSLDFEECAHKLMKMQLKPGQEIELCHMFLDCCAEQRTYEKFYGLLAQRFCNINRIYIGPFEEIFKDSYATAHRLDTNRLRNVSKFFAHLLFTDSISWEVLECVKLNEEDTTSSSRIYIKILFQELAEYMGLKKLNDRLKDPTLQLAFSGVFPRDNPKNTRFSINFFTSIGLGGLTDELREHLKQMPKNVPPPVTEINIDSESSSDTSSSSSSSSSSSGDSSSSDAGDDKQKSKRKSKTKKGKKDKSKKPQTPEMEEANETNLSPKRWGHDGFYDTYGQGARRADQNKSEANRRSNDRDYDNNRRQKYQITNEDSRQNRGRRDGSREGEYRERYNDDSSNKRGDNSRRGRDNEYEMRQRKDDDNERRNGRDDNERRNGRDDNERRNGRDENELRRRRNNDDEKGRRRDEDEVRQRKDDNREMRKRVEDDHENRRGKEPEYETRRRRDYENDRRNDEKRRGGENETRRQKEDEKRQRIDNEEELIQRRADKDVIKGKGDYEKEERGRRDESETQRQKDYDNEIRKRKDKLRESERKREDKIGNRRDNDNVDRRKNIENIERRSKDNEHDRRHRNDSREEKEETRRRRNEEEDVRGKRDELSKRERKNSYDGDKTRKRSNEDSEPKRDKEHDKKQRNKCETSENKKDKKNKTVSDDERKKNTRSKNKKRKREERIHEKNNGKDKKEKRSGKKKEKKKSGTSSESSSSTDSDSNSDSSTDSSDSDSQSDTGISKPSRRQELPRKKSSKKKDIDIDTEKNDCSGRYWDRFDIEIRDPKCNK